MEISLQIRTCCCCCFVTCFLTFLLYDVAEAQATLCSVHFSSSLYRACSFWSRCAITNRQPSNIEYFIEIKIRISSYQIIQKCTALLLSIFFSSKKRGKLQIILLYLKNKLSILVKLWSNPTSYFSFTVSVHNGWCQLNTSSGINTSY